MHNQNFELDAVLKGLRARANNMLMPATAATVVKRYDKMIANREGDLKKTTEEGWKDLVVRSLAGDAAATAEVVRTRITRVNNFLTAMSSAMSFFQEQALADNEAPYIQNHSMNEVLIAGMGPDGGWNLGKPVKYQQTQAVLLDMIASEVIEYPIFDIYQGSLASEMQALFNIARDLNSKISTKLWSFLQGALVSSFTTTGPLVSRHFVTQSNIFQANLPVGNKIDMPGLTTTTQFVKAALDVILRYATQFAGVFEDGDLQPQVVFVPSVHAMGFLDTITMTTAENPLMGQVVETGYVTNYGGRKWVIMPDPTLDPTAGLAYVRMNKPVGIHFTKPGADREVTEQTIEMKLANKARSGMAKAFGAGMPLPWAVNVLAVHYQAQS